MFSARLAGHQGIPAATFVAGAVALATLTAACGSAGSSSSATAVSATVSARAAAGVRAVTSAPVAVGRAAGQPVGKAAGASRPARGSNTTGASESAGAARPAARDSKSPGTGRLTGATATALLSRAIANTQAAASVRVTGEAVSRSTGQAETFDLTLVRNAGCEGEVALTAAKSFKIVDAEGYLWMLPSRAYYASMHMSKQQMAEVENKYVRVSASGQQASQLAAVCTFPGLLGQLGQAGGAAYLAVPAYYDGQAGYRVTEAGQPGTAFVTKSSAPRLLEVTGLRPNRRSIAFASYDATSAITIPTAAQSIDGGSQ